MEELLKYLQKQRDERVKKVEAYTEALDELAAAQKRVDSFGDIGGIEGEIAELESYICEVEAKMGVATAAPSGVIVGDATVNDPFDEQGAEGVVDEIVATCTEE